MEEFAQGRTRENALLLPRCFLAAMSVCLAIVFLRGVVYADEITTVDGQKIVGKVVDETDNAIGIQTTTGDVSLPKSRVKSISRAKISEDEALGDLAMSRKDYYEALRLYEKARESRVESATLPKKLKAVRERIGQKERDLYDSLFQEARTLSAQGQRDAAREVLQRILDQAPKGGPSAKKARLAIAFEYFRDALAAVDRVEYPKAIEKLKQAIATAPDEAIFQLEMGRYLRMYSNDRAGALDHYEKGLELAKKNQALDESERKDYESVTPRTALLDKTILDNCRYEKAEIEFSLGKKQEAAQEFLALYQENPKSFAKGTKYVVEVYTDPDAKLDHAKVLQQLDVALSLEKSSARAWFLKGRIFFDDGDSEKALEAFTKAIELERNLRDVHYYRALAYLRRGEIIPARKDLDAELAVLPTYTLLCELGKVLVMGSEYDKALEQYDRAAQMDPEKFPALLGRARANRLKAMAAGVSPERRKELLGLAGKDIEKVRKKDPKSREAVLESARLHKDRGETAEARDDLKSVIDALEQEMNKEGSAFKREDKQLLAEAYGERGNINIDLGDKNQAQADFEAALKVDPNFALAYNRMGLVAEKMNQFDEAKRKYQKAIDMQPGNPDFELGLGILYQEYLKDYQKALEHYEAFRDKGGMDPRLPAWIQECKNALEKK